MRPLLRIRIHRPRLAARLVDDPPKIQFFTDASLALLGTALIASCDEFHQTFLPNRTGTPWDVLLDCSGALVLELIVYLFARSFRPKRLARAA